MLDIGCGTGDLANFFDGVPNTKYIGLDCSAKMIKPLKETSARRESVVADARFLPFKNGTFDLVLFNSVFHHINGEDHELVLKEALRISKKVVIINDYINADGGLLRYIKDFVWKITDGGKKYRTLNEWHILFEDCEIIKEYRAKPLDHFYSVILRKGKHDKRTNH